MKVNWDEFMGEQIGYAFALLAKPDGVGHENGLRAATDKWLRSELLKPNKVFKGIFANKMLIQEVLNFIGSPTWRNAQLDKKLQYALTIQKLITQSAPNAKHFSAALDACALIESFNRDFSTTDVERSLSQNRRYLLLATIAGKAGEIKTLVSESSIYPAEHKARLIQHALTSWVA